MVYTVQSGVSTIAVTSISDPKPLFANSGVSIEQGTVNVTPNVLTFNCATSGTTITVSSGTVETGSRTNRTYQLNLLSGTLSGGLTNGSFYHVAGLTASTFQLREATEDAGTSGKSAISLTSQTGTAELVDVGISWSINATNVFTASQSHGRNGCFTGRAFTANQDLSNSLVAVEVNGGDTDGNGSWCFWHDSFGEWVMFTLDTANFAAYRWHIFDLATATSHDTYITKSSGTFDATSVAGFLRYVFPNSAASATDAGTGSTIYKLEKAVLTGSGTLSEAIDALIAASPANLQPLAGVYGIAQPIEFGDGGTNTTTLTPGNTTAVFFAKSNGTTSFQYNYDKQAVTLNLGASDSVALDGYTIRSDNVFDFDCTTAIAPTDSSAVGFTLINADLTLDTDINLDSVTYVNLPSVTPNSATIATSVFDNCAAVSSVVLAGQIATVRNATDGIFVDSGNTSPTIDLSDITFSGNTNDIEVRDTSGTVTIIHGTGYTPTFTTDGATVALQTPNITITASGMPTAGGASRRLQITNITGGEAPAWTATTAYVVGDKVLRSTGVGSENTAGLYYVCSTAGTTGGTEPTWSTTPAGTTADGSVVWTTYKVLFYDDDPSAATLNLTYIENRAWKTGDTWDVKFAELDGVTSYKSYSNSGSVGATGFAFQVNETESTVYAANAIDGSSTPVTDIFTADYAADHIDLDANLDFTLPKAYAFYCYETTTSLGMYNFFGAVTALDAGNYRNNVDVASIYFDETAGFVKQEASDNSRWFRSDGARPAIDPTTGGNGLEVNWKNPVNVENLAALEALINAISVQTTRVDALIEDSGGDRFTAKALETASGGGGLTAQAVRDAMKLAPTAGSPAAGSIDEALDVIYVDTQRVDALIENSGGDRFTAKALETAGGGGLTAADIADAVLDEALAGHVTAGTLGKAIADIEVDTNDLQTNQGNWLTATGFATPTNVTDAQTAIITEVNANEAKLDIIDTNIDAILVDTNDLQTNQGNWLTATGFATSTNVTDAQVAIVAEVNANEAKLDIIDTNVDAILVDTGTTVPAQISALNNLSAAQVAAELATYDAPTKAELDAAQSAIIVEVNANETKLDIIDTNVDAILVDTGTTIPAQVSGLNNLSAAQVAAELATYDAPTKAELDATQAAIIAEVNANETKIDTIDTSIDLIRQYHDGQTRFYDTDNTTEVVQSSAYYMAVFDVDNITRIKTISFRDSLDAPTTLPLATRYIAI